MDAQLTDRLGNNQIHWQTDPVMIRCTDRQDQEINVLYDGMTPERRVDLLIKQLIGKASNRQVGLQIDRKDRNDSIDRIKTNRQTERYTKKKNRLD